MADSPNAGEGLVPFDAGKHAGLGIDRGALHRFLAGHNAFPLTLPEFFPASRDYPLVFVRGSDGELGASVITGLRPNENLFLDGEGEWIDSAYLPACVRGYPFYAIDASAGPNHERRKVMVNEAALGASGEAFLDADGEPTPAWRAKEKLITEYLAAQEVTAAFCARLDELELVDPFEAQVMPEQQDSLRLTGMYRVNEQRLNGLPAKTLRRLMKAGQLSRVYAHLISLENFAKLLDLSAAADHS